MGMKPDEFFVAFVIGNYEDCKEHAYCVRRAFNAAVSASHLADHYFEYYKRNDPSKISKYKSIGKYIEYITQNTNNNFRDIRSIANAYKHLYTGSNAYSSISSAGTIDAIQIDDENVTEVSQNPSTKNMNNYIVVYITKTNEQHDLLSTLKSVIDFWENELK